MAVSYTSEHIDMGTASGNPLVSPVDLTKQFCNCSIFNTGGPHAATSEFARKLAYLYSIDSDVLNNPHGENEQKEKTGSDSKNEAAVKRMFVRNLISNLYNSVSSFVSGIVDFNDGWLADIGGQMDGLRLDIAAWFNRKSEIEESGERAKLEESIEDTRTEINTLAHRMQSATDRLNDYIERGDQIRSRISVKREELRQAYDDYGAAFKGFLETEKAITSKLDIHYTYTDEPLTQNEQGEYLYYGANLAEAVRNGLITREQYDSFVQTYEAKDAILERIENVRGRIGSNERIQTFFEERQTELREIIEELETSRNELVAKLEEDQERLTCLNDEIRALDDQITQARDMYSRMEERWERGQQFREMFTDEVLTARTQMLLEGEITEQEFLEGWEGHEALPPHIIDMMNNGYLANFLSDEAVMAAKAKWEAEHNNNTTATPADGTASLQTGVTPANQFAAAVAPAPESPEDPASINPQKPAAVPIIPQNA